MKSIDPLLEKFTTRFDDQDNEGFSGMKSASSLLDSIYTRLPARFPRLFEQLLCTYRWPEIKCANLRLLPNLPGDDFSGFANELFRDRSLIDALLPHGLIPFARAVDGRAYDPICFDTARRRQGGDCPLTRVDHEAALLDNRVRRVMELAPTFHAWVKATLGE
ncbi:MAG TPA: hypothetical protein VHH73_04905 [Verrucomicrobiae bacterium]|nr:hypothetical protein [Verrucomicrobiae bacterium]